MTKLQPNNIKSFDREVKKTIKDQSKKQGFNVISNCIYKKINKYFVCSVFWLEFNENYYKLYMRMNIKLYNYDAIFWEIFDVKDNLNTKDSLRANGAYACPAIQWKEKSYKVKQSESMEEDVRDAILDFQNEIESFITTLEAKYGNFNSYVLHQNDILDESLIKMIANISNENYYAARDIAITEVQNGNRGGYRNKGMDIYEYIIKFCDEQLNM